MKLMIVCAWLRYIFFTNQKVTSPKLKPLSEVVQAGVKTLLWFGDADWVCNYMGGYELAKMVEYPGRERFQKEELAPYTVDGKRGGLFKTIDNLSYLQVFEAGHMLPYYQPKLSLQVLQQMMFGDHMIVPT
jgi:carboxypeptidase C (cathepsin A)